EAEAAARARAKEAAATNPKEPEKQLSLFESDSPSQPKDINPEAERERAEARRKITRQKSVSYFQRTVLPRWMRNQSSEIFGEGNIDGLVAIAQEKVDEDFAESLVLHRYPAKNIYILEFEKPQKVGEYFFVAIKTEERGEPHFYSLEKGISFFGTGDVSVLFEWRSGESISNLGGRKYKDLPRFLQEIETGRPLHSDSD
ncbi:MAG: hypothetical protein OES84_06180, partial [Kiritimatiellaceae bacterium]|nr:hypothetical protein [Kiritimatiellaceae bacterium]